MTNIDELYKEAKESDSQVLSTDQKVDILISAIKDRDDELKSLNHRLKRMETQLKMSGCSIRNSVSSEFTIINNRADQICEILRGVLDDNSK
tara:strand:- start:14903 stop:15178 length:276 start_codon:yes stop_codon:yes gene_type:complete